MKDQRGCLRALAEFAGLTKGTWPSGLDWAYYKEGKWLCAIKDWNPYDKPAQTMMVLEVLAEANAKDAKVGRGLGWAITMEWLRIEAVKKGDDFDFAKEVCDAGVEAMCDKGMEDMGFTRTEQKGGG